MRSIRKLALLGVAVLMVCAAVASSASATTITSPQGTAYSGGVHGVNTGGVVLSTSSGFGTVTCNSSTLKGSVQSNGSNAVISSASWTNCTNNLGQSCTPTAVNLSWTGSVTSPGSGGANGTLTVGGSPYAGAQVVCGSTTCYYGLSSVSVGLYNPGNGATTSQARANVTLNKQSGSSFACSTTATWTATYDLTTDPGGATLWVD